jgi:hypothetical protein
MMPNNINHCLLIWFWVFSLIKMYFEIRNIVLKVYIIFSFMFLGWKRLKFGYSGSKNLDPTKNSLVKKVYFCKKIIYTFYYYYYFLQSNKWKGVGLKFENYTALSIYLTMTRTNVWQEKWFIQCFTCHGAVELTDGWHVSIWCFLEVVFGAPRIQNVRGWEGVQNFPEKLYFKMFFILK